MHRIRGKLTYSNVMVTILALLVLGGGTAYAATEMLPKNSVGSQQIKKEAVTPAKLSKASKAALTGPKGATGATGSAGAQGSQGDAGQRGEKGESGTPAPVGGMLPSGKTVIGAFAFGTGGSGIPRDGISYGYTLSATPSAHYIQKGEADPAGCPGSAATPTAEPGNLCVYEAITSGGVTGTRGVGNPVTDNVGQAASFGAFAYTNCSSACFVEGTWAVTAP